MQPLGKTCHLHPQLFGLILMHKFNFCCNNQKRADLSR